MARYVRVPKQEFLPPGPLATLRLDQQLLQLGLATVEELVQKPKEEEEPWKPRRSYDAEQDEEPKWVLTLAEKLRRLFDYEYPGVFDVRTRPVWAAGELLMEFNGNFNKYVGSKDLLKQEGIVFRHLLRLILLLREFRPLAPPDLDAAAWRYDLDEVVDQLTASCRDGRSHEHGSRAGDGRGAGRRGGEVRRGDPLSDGGESPKAIQIGFCTIKYFSTIRPPSRCSWMISSRTGGSQRAYQAPSG